MFVYPERKQYEYIINTKKGKLVIRLQQATSQETKDFYSMINNINNKDLLVMMENIKDINEYYKNLIKDGIIRDKKRRILKNIKKYQCWLLVKRELEAYIEEVIQLTHRQRKSCYTNTEIPKIKGKKPRTSMFDNMEELVYKKTGIPANKIHNILTAEQIGRYLDKIVFEVYETFEEGKKLNDRLFAKKGLSKEDKKDLEFIKNQLGH